jgi:serine/threonine protein kinase
MKRLPEESSLQTEVAGSSYPEAFGPFRVLHQIGAGTLGPVFRAYESDHDRLVAIKLFRLDLPPERVHRLVGEFEQLIAAGLTHSVLAVPLAAGIEGVAAYLAQEYVTAESLDIVIREGGPAPVADALSVANRLADALDYAAERDVVHGALHPRDVLLSPEDFRLVGVGVTRALERIGVNPPVRRPYTAPERIAGRDWDRRTDVFSLAAVVYELVWGRRIAGTGTQAAATILESPCGSVAALREVFACALADDPGDRFATATAFAEALTRAFEDKPSKVSRLVRKSPARADPMLPLGAEPHAELTLHSVEPAATRDVDPVAGRETDRVDREPVLVPVEIDREPEEPPRMASPIEPPPAFLPERHGPIVPMAADAPPPVPAFARAGLLSSGSPVESSASLVWPLALAGVVGAALGFGAGYAVAIHDRPSTGPADAALIRQSEPVGRETAPSKPESAVTAPAPVPTPGAGAPVAPTRPVAPLFAGRVLVRSAPPGARVFVDGHSGGETPTTVRELARGSHEVRLVREGYTTVERRIVITAGQPAPVLNVTMVKAPPASPPTPAKTEAPLVIDSKPEGAVVFLDGRQVGTTPLTFPLVQVGAHSVRLTLEGYRPWSASVQVQATEPNRVTASLER